MFACNICATNKQISTISLSPSKHTVDSPWVHQRRTHCGSRGRRPQTVYKWIYSAGSRHRAEHTLWREKEQNSVIFNIPLQTFTHLASSLGSSIEHAEGHWQRAGAGRQQELLDGKSGLIREIKLTFSARLHPLKKNKEAFELSQVSVSLLAWS